MKKTITLLAVFGIVLFSSCEGPQGPPGFDGKDGLISEVFEVTTSFNSSNNYSALVPLNPAIYSSDVVLVYRLAGIDQGKDVWKLLPETYYFNDGTLNFGYDFDFTKTSVAIYLFGNDLGSVSTNYRLNQVLRIVIVPGSFSSAINKNNYAEVMAALKVNENQVQKIDF